MTTQRYEIYAEGAALTLVNPQQVRRFYDAGEDSGFIVDPAVYPALFDDGELVAWETSGDGLFRVEITDDPAQLATYELTEPAEFLLCSTGPVLLDGGEDFFLLLDAAMPEDYSGVWLELPVGRLKISVYALTAFGDDTPDFVVFYEPAPVEFRPPQRCGMPAIDEEGVVDTPPTTTIDSWYARTPLSGDMDGNRYVSGQKRLPVHCAPQAVIGLGFYRKERLADTSRDMSERADYLRPFIASTAEDDGAVGCIVTCLSRRRVTADEIEVSWHITGYGQLAQADRHAAELQPHPQPPTQQSAEDLDVMRAAIAEWLTTAQAASDTHNEMPTSTLLRHIAAMTTPAGLLELAFRHIPVPLEVSLQLAVASEALRWELLRSHFTAQ